MGALGTGGEGLPAKLYRVQEMDHRGVSADRFVEGCSNREGIHTRYQGGLLEDSPQYMPSFMVIILTLILLVLSRRAAYMKVLSSKKNCLRPH